jgi:hypothetical protein
MNVLRLHRFGGKPVDEAKPFKIPKREIWADFKRVKANHSGWSR